MMKKLIMFITILSAIFFVVSCEGPQGEEGPQGKDGNANVNSLIFDAQPNNWKGDTNGYRVTMDIPEIDEKIYTDGTVLIYMLTNEQLPNKSFNKLPYTFIDNNFIEYMDYNVYIGSIEITMRQVENDTNKTQLPGSAMAFKILIIEGTPLSVLKTKVDINNYNAVLAYSKNISGIK